MSKYYDYEGGETLTKAQHIKNMRELIKTVSELPADALSEYVDRLEAISEFIQNIDNFANDDVLSVTYFEYSNKFTYELI